MCGCRKKKNSSRGVRAPIAVSTVPVKKEASTSEIVRKYEQAIQRRRYK